MASRLHGRWILAVTQRRAVMNVRHLAAIAVVSSLVVGSGVAWAAPHKPQAHTYVIKAGDSGWWKVAQTHNVTLPQLLAANHATTATPLRVGQTVKLPPQAHDPSKASKPAAPKTAAPKR
jgi:LysM repeat protein